MCPIEVIDNAKFETVVGDDGSVSSDIVATLGRSSII